MSNSRVLLVDDNEGQRLTLESILKRSGFQVTTADCGVAALSAAEAQNFAAVLLDIKMPDLTGIEVLKNIKGNRPDTQVIMMTGYSETDYAIDALNAGASAYLLKPANIEQIKMLLTQAIEHQRLLEENKAMAAALLEWNSELEKKVEARTAQLAEANQLTLDFYDELKQNFESTVEVLSIAIDQRDPLTSSHSFRVTEYALEIGKVLALSEDEKEKLRYAGLLHDLGKIDIEESILCKEGSLTKDEYKEIQTHASGTFELLSKFKFKRNLKEVPLIASSHHERWDGGGYPNGLKGEDIHFMARILGAADVLDAITSVRHYRTSMSIQDALAIMTRESGGHFDPKCIEALFKMNAGSFIKIHLAEHLREIESKDILDLNFFSLQNVFDAINADEPSAEEIKLLNQFYRYYQGPVPVRLKSKVNQGEIFRPDTKKTN